MHLDLGFRGCSDNQPTLIHKADLFMFTRAIKNKCGKNVLNLVFSVSAPIQMIPKPAAAGGGESLKRADGEDPSTALTPVMEAATEKEGDREVLTEGAHLETDRGGTETEREGRATAETGKEKEMETKARSEIRGAKTGMKGGV